METKVISIQTRRYSEVFRRILREYATGTTVLIDGRSYPASEFPRLIESWCTNAKIADTGGFQLMRGETELFGFDDHPSGLWAAYSELPFVERLASERVVRYRISSGCPSPPPWAQGVIVILVFAAVAVAMFLLFRWLEWLF